MRQIKFRGKTLDGKIVFGYYVPTCPMSSFPGIVDDMDYIHAIEPDSIAQLVGHDKDGNEVYEGDILVREFYGKRYEYKAHLGSFATADDGCYIGEKQFATSTLKEKD